jgi:hypothetical protein
MQIGIFRVAGIARQVQLRGGKRARLPGQAQARLYTGIDAGIGDDTLDRAARCQQRIFAARQVTVIAYRRARGQRRGSQRTGQRPGDARCARGSLHGADSSDACAASLRRTVRTRIRIAAACLPR